MQIFQHSSFGLYKVSHSNNSEKSPMTMILYETVDNIQTFICGDMVQLVKFYSCDLGSHLLLLKIMTFT